MILAGDVGGTKTVIGLSIHVADNDDYFRFYMPADGGGGDFVRIDFLHSVGDLDIQLYDDGGNVRASSTSTSDEEVISMSGRPRGWYYLRVYGYNGVTHPDYSLTIDPSENASPSITVVDPPAGDVELLHSIDSYPVTWNSSDPEGDQLWCSIWVNTTPTLDGNEIFLETSQNTPAELELYVLASTYLPLGTFYVYATITDGGTVVGDWSEGTFTLIPQTPVAAPSDRVIVQTRLLPSTPNPFNPSTLLKLELNRTVTVSWDIYDLRGVRVRQIPAGHLHAGVHTRTWNGKDDRGQAVSSGVYFAVVRGAKINLSQKLVLLK